MGLMLGRLVLVLKEGGSEWAAGLELLLLWCLGREGHSLLPGYKTGSSQRSKEGLGWSVGMFVYELNLLGWMLCCE